MSRSNVTGIASYSKVRLDKVSNIYGLRAQTAYYVWVLIDLATVTCMQ